MDLRQPLALASLLTAAFSIGSVVAWAACRWWYGRKLAAAALRLEKSDKGRQFSQQQTLQARRQIEQLKAELEVRPRSAGAGEAALRMTCDGEAAPRAAHPGPRDDDRVPVASARGFAETQIQRGGFVETQIQGDGFAKTQVFR